MDNTQFIQIAQVLNQLAYFFQNKNDIPIKFAYGLKRNLGLVNAAATVLDNKMQFPPSAFPDEFEKSEFERRETCIKYAEVDDKGGPVIENGKYKLIEDKIPEFNAEMQVLVDKYPNIKKEREDHESFQKELLSSAAPEIEFYKIKISCFPAYGITLEQLDILTPIIDDTPEEQRLVKLFN